MRSKKTKKPLLVILFFVALVALGLMIKTKIETTKIEEITRYRKKAPVGNVAPTINEARIALNPDIPERKIHLSWDKLENYDVVFNANHFLLHAEEEAKQLCEPDVTEYDQCDKAMQCLQLLKDSLVMNDITETEFKEKFSVTNYPNCIYETNKDVTLQEYWLFRYGYLNSGDPRMTIINTKTGESLDYYVDKYVLSCASVKHDYYDPDGNWMFSRSSWAECYP